MEIIRIEKVKSSDLKFDTDLVKVSPSVSADVPVVVDKDLRVIFGDNAARKAPEVVVAVVDSDFEEARIAMHATGRWAEPNWKRIKATEAIRFGFTAFTDGFLFKEAPKHLEFDRHPDTEAGSYGELF